MPAPEVSAALHTGFPPLLGAKPHSLILGSMPGTRSLEEGRYYAHPHNAFWPILASFCDFSLELDYQQRCQALVASGFALWDVLHQCRRSGSLDTAIQPASEVANDLAGLLRREPGIRRILFNGLKAEQAFRRHQLPLIDARMLVRMDLLRLPSTSPANARLRLAEKQALWHAALAAP